VDASEFAAQQRARLEARDLFHRLRVDVLARFRLGKEARDLAFLELLGQLEVAAVLCEGGSADAEDEG